MKNYKKHLTKNSLNLPANSAVRELASLTLELIETAEQLRLEIQQLKKARQRKTKIAVLKK